MIRLAKIPAWQTKALMASEAESELWAAWGEILVDNVWRRPVIDSELDAEFEDWVELSKFGEEMVRHNIGFMKSFRFNRVSGSGSGVAPIQLDSMFHAVMASNYATLHELRTIYSLEDVFLMLDSITTTKVNEKIALANASAGK